MEAEKDEIHYSESESDIEYSENEVSDEDLDLAREFVNSQEKLYDATPSILAVHERKKAPKLTTETLDSDNILVKRMIHS